MQTQFKKFLREYMSMNRIGKESLAFTTWYAGIRSSIGRRDFTDGKDGGIDLLITTPTELIICQTKFGKGKIDQVRAFSDVRRAWSDGEKGFRNWLAGVKNERAKTAYREAYKASKDRKLVWEFVSLSEDNSTWRRILSQGLSESVDARLVSINDVLYYFSLDKMGSTYVDPIKVRAAPTSLNDVTSTEFGEIKTLVCMVRVSSLLSCLRKSADWERVLSRNVRVRRTKSAVNQGIQSTYTTEPQAFFYGNNGLHIIATEAHLSGTELYAEQPAIINGGQTISSLMALDSHSGTEAHVLTRVTVIPKEVQLKPKCAKFIEDIVVRSNSNNRMESWDLRSNDEVQVDLARGLFRHQIYYERKVNEWDVYSRIEKPNINMRLDICELAEILATCSTGYGPVKYRAHGLEPLFEKGEKGQYAKIFAESVLSNLDETVSKIRLDHAITKATRSISRASFGQFQSFPRSAKNYLLGVLWLRLRDEGIEHPFPEYEQFKRNRKKWDKAIHTIIRALYRRYRTVLQQGVNINDVFRTDIYWEQCKKTIHSRNPAYKTVISCLKDS
jgi:hypothetical protein